VIPVRPMEQRDPNEAEARLDDLFRAYREACPAPDASATFMPDMWARIEAREVSRSWFGRVAKVLVITALALSVVLGTMISATNQSNAFFNATFVEALRADHASKLEPLHLDRISQLDSE
jgi:hypothetical protein